MRKIAKNKIAHSVGSTQEVVEPLTDHLKQPKS